MPQTNKGIYTCMYKHLSFILTWKKHRFHKMLLIMLINVMRLQYIEYRIRLKL